MPALKNNKHELFALGLVEGKTADQAYIDAGYNRHDGNAARLRGKERIIARVKELQEQHVKRHNVTVGSLTEKLESARIHAMAADNGASAAVSAVMGMAKLHGLDINKHEHGGTGSPIEISDISQAEKARVIAAALAEVVND